MCQTQEAKTEHNHQTHEIQHHPELQLPSSPWAKLFKKVSRRKLKNTAKINLNKYWSKFGEIMTSPSKPKKINNGACKSHAKKRLFQDEESESNQDYNLTGIIPGRYEILDEDEIDQNIANEIRELISFKNTPCQLCTNH